MAGGINHEIGMEGGILGSASNSYRYPRHSQIRAARLEGKAPPETRLKFLETFRLFSDSGCFAGAAVLYRLADHLVRAFWSAHLA